MFFINHTDIGEGSAAIIEVEGPLNSDSTPDFDDYISKLTDNNIIYLLLDMKNLNFISSEGIGATLMIQKIINEKNGLAVFFNLNYEIASLFKLLGFDSVFTIASDRADALHILDKHMELFPPGTEFRNSENIKIKPEPSSREESIEQEIELLDSESLTEIKENETNFESFVIECIKCRSLIRIKESGEQLCPYCNAEFSVTDRNKAVFQMNEINS